MGMLADTVRLPQEAEGRKGPGAPPADQPGAEGLHGPPLTAQL